MSFSISSTSQYLFSNYKGTSAWPIKERNFRLNENIKVLTIYLRHIKYPKRIVYTWIYSCKNQAISNRLQSIWYTPSGLKINRIPRKWLGITKTITKEGHICNLDLCVNLRIPKYHQWIIYIEIHIPTWFCNNPHNPGPPPPPTPFWTMAQRLVCTHL